MTTEITSCLLSFLTGDHEAEVRTDGGGRGHNMNCTVNVPSCA